MPGTSLLLCSDTTSPGFQVRGVAACSVCSLICLLCLSLSAEMFAELQSAALPARPGWGHVAAAEQMQQTACGGGAAFLNLRIAEGQLANLEAGKKMTEVGKN